MITDTQRHLGHRTVPGSELFLQRGVSLNAGINSSTDVLMDALGLIYRAVSIPRDSLRQWRNYRNLRLSYSAPGNGRIKCAEVGASAQGSRGRQPEGPAGWRFLGRRFRQCTKHAGRGEQGTPLGAGGMGQPVVDKTIVPPGRVRGGLGRYFTDPERDTTWPRPLGVRDGVRDGGPASEGLEPAPPSPPAPHGLGGVVVGCFRNGPSRGVVGWSSSDVHPQPPCALALAARLRTSPHRGLERWPSLSGLGRRKGKQGLEDEAGVGGA